MRLPEHDGDEGDEAASGGHAFDELGDDGDGEMGTGEAAEHAAEDDAKVLNTLNVDAEAAGSLRVFTDGAEMQADGVSEEEDVGKANDDESGVDDDGMTGDDLP